jgi:serine/threonine-protein kinase RsbW
MKNSHKLTVPASKRQIAVVSEFIADLMASSGFDAKAILEVQLAAEEACNNVASYAYPYGEGSMDIGMEIADDHLELTIADGGAPFDPTAKRVAVPDIDVEHRPIGGLGIALIRSMVDGISYEYKDGKNVLRITKERA